MAIYPVICSFYYLARALMHDVVCEFACTGGCAETISANVLNKAMLHEAIFLAACNATMTNKKPFKLQRGCHTFATFFRNLQRVQ